MLWSQIVFPSTISIWEALLNATNCYHIMQFQRSQSSGGQIIFFRLLELCVINSMYLFFEKNPEFGRKRNSRKKYREMLIHELVQPLLHKWNDDEQQISAADLNLRKDLELMCKVTFVLETGIMQPRSIPEGTDYVQIQKEKSERKKNQQKRNKLLW